MRNDDISLQLYLLRHGESLGNLAFDDHVEVNIEFDRYNPPLSAQGVEQARAAGERLCGTAFDAVYVSELLRAKQTAQETICRLNNPTVFYRTDILEQGTRYENGAFCGFDEDEYACASRAKRIIDEMRQKYTKGESVLIVSHGAFMQFLIKAALGVEPPQGVLLCVYNASISKLNFRNDGKVKLAVSNDISHLGKTDGEKLFWM